MQKEAGYDEFLAEKIRIGREQIAHGEVISKEQMQAEMQTLFAKLAKEQAERDEQEFSLGAMYG